MWQVNCKLCNSWFVCNGWRCSSAWRSYKNDRYRTHNDTLTSLLHPSSIHSHHFLSSNVLFQFFHSHFLSYQWKLFNSQEWSSSKFSLCQVNTLSIRQVMRLMKTINSWTDLISWKGNRKGVGNGEQEGGCKDSRIFYLGRGGGSFPRLSKPFLTEKVPLLYTFYCKWYPFHIPTEGS